MPTIRLIGRAFPSGLSWKTKSEYTTLKGDEGCRYSTAVSISDSDVEVSCAGEELTNSDMPRCLLSSYEIVSTMLDLHGFYHGIATSVSFSKYESVEGIIQDFRLDDLGLASIVDSFEYEKQFDDLQDLLLAEPLFREALRDLVHSLANVNESTINCARSVEAVRHMIAGDDSLPTADAWAKMRTALNIRREYLEPLMQASLKPRHGKRVPMLGDVRYDLIKRAWNVMNRYISWRRRGLIALTAPDYPQL